MSHTVTTKELVAVTENPIERCSTFPEIRKFTAKAEVEVEVEGIRSGSGG